MRTKYKNLWRIAMVIMLSVCCVSCSDKPALSVDGNLMVVIESADHFDQAVLESDKPVLVDFWAAYCPLCRKMNPVVAETAGVYNNVLDVAKVDLEKNRNLAERFQIRAIPTFVLFYKGKALSAHEGAMKATAFKKWIEDNLKQLEVEIPLSNT